MADAAPREAHGVIHDIGFRHYDGARLGRGWIVRSLVVETLRGVWGLGRPARVKVMPWLLLSFITIPALVMAVVVILLDQEELPLSYSAYPIAMWLLVTLFVGGRAPYAVSRDLRDGVIPLYLSRPLTRRDYVLAKLVGVSIGVFLFTVVPETVLLVGALLAKLPVGTHLWGWLGGVVICALLSAIVSAIGLVIAAVTPRRGLGVAAVVATFILLNGIVSTIVGVLQQVGIETPSRYAAALDPFFLVNGIGIRVLGAPGIEGLHAPEGFAGGAVFLAWYALLVLGCVGILMRRYRKVGGV